ncbi:hypothetical protein [Shinella zoogloeoides]|jgi:hypothetical protein|uniref:Uncharacterized protein n=1 Tax=Shinella zoogloeoides TaxID=352475 RepID=A0A6N8TGU5_SHIZO|nr:hypothetical protein [Shinella zoogloeoides]MXO02472.1 hypothetical protein [Shinella zoogloeoides]UEX81929.1 hypothetical protein K8M09_01090 [Shinella zoogloeoides]
MTLTTTPHADHDVRQAPGHFDPLHDLILKSAPIWEVCNRKFMSLQDDNADDKRHHP